jgi:hypothetical protein
VRDPLAGLTASPARGRVRVPGGDLARAVGRRHSVDAGERKSMSPSGGFLADNIGDSRNDRLRKIDRDFAVLAAEAAGTL